MIKELFLEKADQLNKYAIEAKRENHFGLASELSGKETAYREMADCFSDLEKVLSEENIKRLFVRFMKEETVGVAVANFRMNMRKLITMALKLPIEKLKN